LFPSEGRQRREATFPLWAVNGCLKGRHPTRQVHEWKLFNKIPGAGELRSFHLTSKHPVTSCHLYKRMNSQILSLSGDNKKPTVTASYLETIEIWSSLATVQPKNLKANSLLFNEYIPGTFRA
jgi:hypothetical protein